ncbi:MAG: MarR family winged helix-turn-helix transcriptional regulator [Candidatus Polarisedimenticolia bacterium]
MKAVASLERQAQELDRLLTTLIKRYQFRDRNSICCEGVTVSQCYVLKELGQRGPLTMTALAGAMCLAVSTLTRVVAQLERRGHVARRPPAGDRRVREVSLTGSGAALLRTMERRIRASEQQILETLTPADRAGLLRGLRRLTQALDKGKANDQTGCVRSA